MLMKKCTLLVITLSTLAACGDSASGAGGDTSGGGGQGPQGGEGGQGGAAASCVCEDPVGSAHYTDKECFCLEQGFGCSAEMSIASVLEPSCPGALVHPISVSCKIGGVVYLIREDFVIGSRAYFYDRDTEELVGLYVSSDAAEYCDSNSETVRWGNIAASCELCDPCSAENPDYPPCPAPEE